MQTRQYSIPVVLILVFLLLISGIVAQEIKNVQKSVVKEIIQGKEFYIHTVKNSETLFAISRTYELDVDEIKAHNFALTENIVPGQIIKIPVVGLPQLIETSELPKSSFNYRRVQQGETLYGIAREYGISVDEIKNANNGLPDGLKSGMFLKIPEKNSASGFDSGQNPQDGKPQRFFEYQAKERISVYKLALRYRVSIDSIYYYNMGIDEQLRTGQIIKIPLIDHRPGFITHTVKKRETVVRLAKKYEMDVDLIRSINPYISRHLVVGQVVRIPLMKMDDSDGPPLDQPLPETEAKDTKRPKSSQESCHESYEMKSYKVALLMPLYFSNVDSIISSPEFNERPHSNPAYIKSYTFIQFYQGFMMAVDSLVKTGLNVKVYVYNSENDVAQTRAILQNPELKQMDLIIGPFFSQNFKMVADFARDHKINIVNPLSTREEVTVGNPYVFQPQPLRNSQFDALINFLNEEHGHSQIFIARHNPYQDDAAVAKLQTILNQQLEPRKIPTTSLYHEIVYSRDSLFTFLHTASVNHENVMITYSENKLFILDLTRKLNQLRDTFQITMIGMPNWREIEGLEYEHLNNLNTHFISDQHIDYENPLVKNFVSAYHRKYITDPGLFAFNGFNIGTYFLSALMKYGKNFNECIPYFPMELLNMGYDFDTSDGKGYNNINWEIQRMERFKLKELTSPLPVYDLSKPPDKYYQYMDFE